MYDIFEFLGVLDNNLRFKMNIEEVNKQIVKTEEAIKESENSLEILKQQLKYFKEARDNVNKEKYNKESSFNNKSLGEKVVETSFEYMDATLITGLKHKAARILNLIDNYKKDIEDSISRNTIDFGDKNKEEKIFAVEDLRNANSYICKAFHEITLVSMFTTRGIAKLNKINANGDARKG